MAELNLLDEAPTASSDELHDDLAVARLVTEHAADAIFLLDGEGRTTYANPEAEAMFGWSVAELKGRTLHDVIHYQHPDGRPYPMGTCPLGRVFASGQSLQLHEDLFFRKDGSAVPVACSNAAIRRNGGVIGGVVIVRDISERQEAERRQSLLIEELHHRVKNTLAVVQSIALQTFKGEGMHEMHTAFAGRLAALAGAHSLLTQSGWTAASLADVVKGALRPFAGEERVTVGGPDVTLPTKASVSLALALHELATNAAKYGALSVPNGRVSVHWEVLNVAAAPRLRLVWQEAGGPLVTSPERRGFGSRMLERGLAAELAGRVAIAFEPQGVRCTIEARLPG